MIGTASSVAVIGAGLYLINRPHIIDIPKQLWSDKTKKLIMEMTGGKTISQSNIQLDIAHFIENGAQASFRATMPGYAPSDIKALHIIASKNPSPLSASFFFSPASGEIMVSSRLRLAVSQPVLALAEMKDGQFFLDSKPTDVHIKGCTP